MPSTPRYPSSTSKLSIAAIVAATKTQKACEAVALPLRHIPIALEMTGIEPATYRKSCLCFTKACSGGAKNTIHKVIAFFEKRDDVSVFLFDTYSVAPPPKNISSANNDGSFDINYYVYTSPQTANRITTNHSCVNRHH